MKHFKIKLNTNRFFFKNYKLLIKIPKFKLYYLKRNYLQKNILIENKNLILKNKRNFFFFFNKSINFLNFLQVLKISYKNLSYGSVKILKLEGIGYKIYKVKNKLFLDLGLSHYLIFNIPFEIILLINKKYLYCFSYYSQILSNFILKIKYFKKKNAYQLKGIFYNTENFKLKLGKQK